MENTNQMERERFLRVVSMNETSAKAFAMPDAVKVVCTGQADPRRYKFGAREYWLFATWDEYNAYLRDRDSAPGEQGAFLEQTPCLLAQTKRDDSPSDA